MSEELDRTVGMPPRLQTCRHEELDREPWGCHRGYKSAAMKNLIANRGNATAIKMSEELDRTVGMPPRLQKCRHEELDREPWGCHCSKNERRHEELDLEP